MTDKKERPKRGDFSPLDAHHRRGKVFTPPLMRVSDNMELHSWHNERLPEALWAAGTCYAPLPKRTSPLPTWYSGTIRKSGRCTGPTGPARPSWHF